jgi:periplasmic protein TonB
MKKKLNIFIMSLALLAAAACTSNKSEKTAEEYGVNDTPAISTPSEITLEERREKIEMQRIARVEKRRIEFEQRIKMTPYYVDEQKNVVYNKAEVDPTFSGGEEAMHKYLQENMKYPAQAEKDALEGTVFVDFIVVANGSVREVIASDMSGEEADQSLRDEAIRVVSNMPKWIPGRQHGKPVDVKFSLPITFRMI